MAGRVVDASAAAMVLFGEPGAKKAAAALDGHELHAPSLLPYEVASVARKKALAHPELAPGIFAAARRLENLAIILLDVDAAEVARLAVRLDVSAYDAAYLWLADRLCMPLVSFDRRLLAASRRA